MATKTANTEVAAGSADEEQVTLTEFCIRLSATVKSPELIGGFEHTEKALGTVKDAPSAFQARFDKFVTTPV